MTRHIRLPLGTTTSDGWCGNCPHVNANLRRCNLLREKLVFAAGLKRCDECRAAEVKEDDDAE